MYTQYFLRFATQEEFQQKMTELGYLVEIPETETTYYQLPGLGSAIDIVGDIYNNDAVFDENGNLIQEATKMNGYHINMLLSNEETLNESLTEFLVTPTQPHRIFLGYNVE